MGIRSVAGGVSKAQVEALIAEGGGGGSGAVPTLTEILAVSNDGRAPSGEVCSGAYVAIIPGVDTGDEVGGYLALAAGSNVNSGQGASVTLQGGGVNANGGGALVLRAGNGIGPDTSGGGVSIQAGGSTEGAGAAIYLGGASLESGKATIVSNNSPGTAGQVLTSDGFFATWETLASPFLSLPTPVLTVTGGTATWFGSYNYNYLALNGAGLLDSRPGYSLNNFGLSGGAGAQITVSGVPFVTAFEGSTGQAVTVTLSDLATAGSVGLTANGGEPLTALAFPALTTAQGFTVNNFPNLTSISIPILTTAQSFGVNNNTALTTLDLSALTTASVYINGLTALTTLDLSALTTTADALYFSGLTALTTITLPAIVSIGGDISDFENGGLTALTTFTLGATLKSVAGNVDFGSTSGAILTEVSVDNILVRLAALDGTSGTTSYDGHIVHLGGSCAIPSATGLAAKATLEARGNTVTVND